MLWAQGGRRHLPKAHISPTPSPSDCTRGLSSVVRRKDRNGILSDRYQQGERFAQQSTAALCCVLAHRLSKAFFSLRALAIWVLLVLLLRCKLGLHFSQSLKGAVIAAVAVDEELAGTLATPTNKLPPLEMVHADAHGKLESIVAPTATARPLIVKAAPILRRSQNVPGFTHRAAAQLIATNKKSTIRKKPALSGKHFDMKPKAVVVWLTTARQKDLKDLHESLESFCANFNSKYDYDGE